MRCLKFESSKSVEFPTWDRMDLEKKGEQGMGQTAADERDLQIIRVPGAYEMPIAAQRLAAAKRFDAIIALGAVIRGGTPHFEYVAGECTKGLSSVSLKHDIPIAFGVLTVDSIEQAIERAGTKAGNKGAEAAMSTIEMINLLRGIEG